MRRILLIFSLCVLLLIPQNGSAMEKEDLQGVSAFDIAYFLPLVVIPLCLVKAYGILKTFMLDVRSPNEYAPLSDNPAEQDISFKKLYIVHDLLELIRHRLLELSAYDWIPQPSLKRHLWLAINIAMVLLSKHGESAQLSIALYHELLKNGINGVRLCVLRDKRNKRIAHHTFLVLTDNRGILWAMDPTLDAMMVPLAIYWTDKRFLSYFRRLLLDGNWMVSQDVAVSFSMEDVDLKLLGWYVNYLSKFANDETIPVYISTLNEIATERFDSALREGEYPYAIDFSGDDSGGSR